MSAKWNVPLNIRADCLSVGDMLLVEDQGWCEVLAVEDDRFVELILVTYEVSGEPCDPVQMNRKDVVRSRDRL